MCRSRQADKPIGTAPVEDLLGPFGQDRTVTHLFNHMGQVIVIDEFRMAKGRSASGRKAI